MSSEAVNYQGPNEPEALGPSRAEEDFRHNRLTPVEKFTANQRVILDRLEAILADVKSRPRLDQEVKFEVAASFPRRSGLTTPALHFIQAHPEVWCRHSNANEWRDHVLLYKNTVFTDIVPRPALGAMMFEENGTVSIIFRAANSHQ